MGPGRATLARATARAGVRAHRATAPSAPPGSTLKRVSPMVEVSIEMTLKRLRKQQLVDAKMQLSVAWSMGIALLVLSLAYGITFWVSSADELLPSSTSTRALGMLVTGAYFLLVFVATIACGVMATQRIAGPAKVIEDAVRGMREKDYRRRLSLRDGDHLKSLAAEVAGLRDEIVAAEAARTVQLEKIAAALSAGRYDEARQLCEAADGEAGARPEPEAELAAAGSEGRDEGGYTLLEIMVSIVVVVVAALGILMSLTSGVRLQQQTGDYAIANRAIAEVHATLRDGDLDTRIAEFKAAPITTIQNVSVEVRFPQQQLVDMLGTSIPAGWRYRDLNSDGDVDLDPSATLGRSLVPVTITARWGSSAMDTRFFLTEQ